MRSFLIGIFVFFITISTSGQNNFKVNDTVPNFKLWLTDGTRLTNKEIKGKVVVFKFWFTSCMPCLTDIPKLNNLVEELKERDDILFIAPALDRKPVIEKLLKIHPFKFQTAYSSIEVSRIFNKTSIQ